MHPITITAHLDSAQCELWRNGDEIVAYCPTKEHATATLGLNVSTFTEAETKARAMGLEPKWSL